MSVFGGEAELIRFKADIEPEYRPRELTASQFDAILGQENFRKRRPATPRALHRNTEVLHEETMIVVAIVAQDHIAFRQFSVDLHDRLPCITG